MIVLSVECLGTFKGKLIEEDLPAETLKYNQKEKWLHSGARNFLAALLHHLNKVLRKINWFVRRYNKASRKSYF